MVKMRRIVSLRILLETRNNNVLVSSLLFKTNEFLKFNSFLSKK